MLHGKRIYVAGHTGLVGSALCRRLQNDNCEILTVPRSKLDLRDQPATHQWITQKKPDIIILAAAKVGGIKANMNDPEGFLNDNLHIQNNVINAAHEIGVEKFLFLGSSCIYPKDAPQPIKETALGTGTLETTNEAYATAKIAGIKRCQTYPNFISVMPCNLYGPHDRYDLENSHVIPALMMKAYTAKMNGDKTLEIWGSGMPRREFLHVDDLADALVHVLKHYNDPEPINIGAGTDVTIKELAECICETVGFDGRLTFNTAQPDGVKAKLMDSSKITALGWKPLITLKDGLKQTYEWYKHHAG